MAVPFENNDIRYPLLRIGTRSLTETSQSDFLVARSLDYERSVLRNFKDLAGAKGNPRILIGVHCNNILP